MTDPAPALPEAERLAEDAGDAVPLRLVPRAGLDDALSALTEPQRAFVSATGFEARLGQTAFAPAADGAIAAVLFGWGDAPSRRRSRFHLGAFSAKAPAGRYRLEADLEPAELEAASSASVPAC